MSSGEDFGERAGGAVEEEVGLEVVLAEVEEEEAEGLEGVLAVLNWDA